MTEEIIKDLENYKNKIDDYKQLKRLEQERDELKKVCEKCKLFDIEKTNRDLLERIDKLEQENKELKDRNVELQITLNEFDRFNNYRSALEKIKAIINQPCDNCKYNKDGVTCSIGDCGEGKLKIIENKINEVLGNEV